jgi:hypothetical protein
MADDMQRRFVSLGVGVQAMVLALGHFAERFTA